MTEPIERFSVDSLLSPELGVRVMRPRLRGVDVHWHDYYELSLVVSGAAEHVVNGESRSIGPGSAFLLSPADFHALEAVGDEPFVCYNAVIDSPTMERQLAAIGGPAIEAFPWHAERAFDLEPDLRRLQSELDEQRLGSARLTDALAGCLVIELARRSGLHDRPAPRRPTTDEELRGAVSYVDRHFREPLSLADAAASAHLSPNYFSERFREVTGTSFQLYLQERRLRFARSLLMSTGLPVTDVCRASGFNDVSHFGRVFRRRYGAPPSAARDGKHTK